MQEIKVKSGLLLVSKHKKTQTKSDLIIEELDGDKQLITGEVLSEGCDKYPRGTTVIFGKYSIYKLVLQGEDFHFLEEEDVLGTCDYKE